MSTIISRILGQKIQEAAWTESDIINAIVGCCGNDVEKWKEALGAIKKGQLKKIYSAASGQNIEAEEGDEVEPEGNEEEVQIDVAPEEGGEEVDVEADEPGEEEEEDDKPFGESVVNRMIGGK